MKTYLILQPHQIKKIQKALREGVRNPKLAKEWFNATQNALQDKFQLKLIGPDEEELESDDENY